MNVIVMYLFLQAQLFLVGHFSNKNLYVRKH